MSLRRKQQELEEKKLTFFSRSAEIHDAVNAGATAAATVQTNNIQVMMMQQSQAFMAVLDKLTNKLG